MIFPAGNNQGPGEEKLDTEVDLKIATRNFFGRLFQGLPGGAFKRVGGYGFPVLGREIP